MLPHTGPSACGCTDVRFGEVTSDWASRNIYKMRTREKSSRPISFSVNPDTRCTSAAIETHESSLIIGQEVRVDVDWTLTLTTRIPSLQILRHQHRGIGLDITHRTGVTKWDGQSMDYFMAVDGLLARRGLTGRA